MPLPFVAISQLSTVLKQQFPFWAKQVGTPVSDSNCVRVPHSTSCSLSGAVEPDDWPWSSFRHYATRKTGAAKIRVGVDSAGAAGTETFVQNRNYPALANNAL
jgi:hypothetical protein